MLMTQVEVFQKFVCNERHHQQLAAELVLTLIMIQCIITFSNRWSSMSTITHQRVALFGAPNRVLDFGLGVADLAPSGRSMVLTLVIPAVP